MSVKEFLKKNRWIRNTVKKARILKAYFEDAIYFCNNYIEGTDTQKRLEYRLLFLTHNIEKGMSRKDKRPFGKDKVKNIISHLKNYENRNYDVNVSAYKMARSVLVEWKKLWIAMAWDADAEIEGIFTYIDAIVEHTNCGVKTVVSADWHTSTYKEFTESRHSIRNFADRELSQSDIDDVLDLLRLTPTACNRQMCKVYQIKSISLKNYLFNVIQGIPGFERATTNLFVVTYDTNSLFSAGERNQGYFNAGLFTMSLVNAMHSKGIGSCILQWGNRFCEEKQSKDKLNIPENERIAAIVAAGYYPDSAVIPVSKRKETYEIYSIIEK